MATLTLTFSDAVAVRLRDAVTETLSPVDAEGAPRQANMSDLKDYVIADLRQIVRNSEKRQAAAALPTPTEVDLT